MLENDMLIRPASVNDASELAAIGAKTFVATYEWYNTREDMQEYIDKNFTVNALEIDLHSKNTHYFVAETGNKIIGYLKLNEVMNTYIPKLKAVEIARFYLDKDYQGLRIGKKLMETGENFAKTNQFEAIWLGVWQKNEQAIAVYKKLGYTIAGTTTFTLGSDVQDDFIMVKTL